MTIRTKKLICIILLFELFIECKIKYLLSWIWLQCKDWKTLVFFILWWIICGSPIWVGYILFIITKNGLHLTYANACIAFWVGPGTPEIPLCITLAIGTRRLISKKFHK